MYTAFTFYSQLALGREDLLSLLVSILVYSPETASPSWPPEVVGHTASAVRKQKKNKWMLVLALVSFKSFWSYRQGVTPSTFSVSALSSINPV